MKKIITLVLAFSMVFSLCACGGTSISSTSTATDTPATTEEAAAADEDYEPFTIRIATAKADKNNQSTSAVAIANYIEEKTNGKVTVEVYTNSTLLSEDAMLDGMIGHTTDIGIQSVGPYSGYVPEVDVYSLVGIFSSIDKQIETFEAEDGILNYINGLIEEKLNIVTLGQIIDIGTSCLGNSEHPINTIEDAAGLTYRAPNSAIATAITSIGGVPVTLSSSDAYTAIQNGVCQGVYCSATSFINNQFNQICGYATNLPGTPLNYVNVMVAKDTWESWPKSVQDIILEVCDQLHEETKELAYTDTTEAWDTIAETCEVVTLDEETIEDILEIIRPEQLASLKAELEEDSYNKIIGIIEKYK